MTSCPSLSGRSICEDLKAFSTIAEVSRRFNLSLRTLRFYEQVELLQPKRVGMQRLYSPGDIVRLEIILLGRKFGFSLREIGLLIRSHASDGQETQNIFALLDAPTVERQLAELERQKVELDAAIVELKEAAGRMGNATTQDRRAFPGVRADRLERA